VNKTDLISYIASEAEISKADATQAVEAFCTAIFDGLKKSGEVSLPPLGKFVVSQRAASTGRNPRTGEAIKIAASKQVKFRPGKAVKDHVNKKGK
jgi:DNA-binding protein HU-beta